jgi:hypothetical protein
VIWPSDTNKLPLLLRHNRHALHLTHMHSVTSPTVILSRALVWSQTQPVCETFETIAISGYGCHWSIVASARRSSLLPSSDVRKYLDVTISHNTRRDRALNPEHVGTCVWIPALLAVRWHLTFDVTGRNEVSSPHKLTWHVITSRCKWS